MFRFWQKARSIVTLHKGMSKSDRDFSAWWDWLVYAWAVAWCGFASFQAKKQVFYIKTYIERGIGDDLSESSLRVHFTHKLVNRWYMNELFWVGACYCKNSRENATDACFLPWIWCKKCMLGLKLMQFLIHCCFAHTYIILKIVQ